MHGCAENKRGAFTSGIDGGGGGAQRKQWRWRCRHTINAYTGGERGQLEQRPGSVGRR